MGNKLCGSLRRRLKARRKRAASVQGRLTSSFAKTARQKHCKSGVPFDSIVGVRGGKPRVLQNSKGLSSIYKTSVDSLERYGREFL